MVTLSPVNFSGFFRLLPYAIFWLGALPAVAQDEHAYVVSIFTDGRSPLIRGFLHSVNDSAVVILPAQLTTKKGLKAALDRPNLINIPTKVIRKLKVMRLRSSASVFLTGMLVASGYSLIHVLTFPIATPLDFILYVASMSAVTFITMDLMYNTKFKPTEAGFAFKMQKYCLAKSALFLDR